MIFNKWELSIYVKKTYYLQLFCLQAKISLIFYFLLQRNIIFLINFYQFSGSSNIFLFPDYEIGDNYSIHNNKNIIIRIIIEHDEQQSKVLRKSC